MDELRFQGITENGLSFTPPPVQESHSVANATSGSKALKNHILWRSTFRREVSDDPLSQNIDRINYEISKGPNNTYDGKILGKKGTVFAGTFTKQTGIE